MNIKFESAAIMVKDVATSRRFYEDVLEQEVMFDFGPNVSFAGGLFSIWQVDHAHEIMFGDPAGDVGQGEMEVYFEADDLDAVMERLTDAEVEFVHSVREQPWGQRVVRAYDPDGHIVEVGEPIPVFVARFLNQGMSVEQAAERTGMPVEIVRQIAANVGGDQRGQDGPGGSRDAGMTENMEEKMNTVELIQYSLGNAFDILGQVVADLTQEQADWAPPGIANPIGATYWHTVSSVDEIVHKWVRGEDPLCRQDGWQEKVLAVSAPEPERGGDYLAYMRAICVDLAALHAYTKAVAEAVQGWLASLTPEDLERELETPIGKLNVGQMLETFVIWHVNAHCGEIAALKGCLGVKGYPF